MFIARFYYAFSIVLGLYAPWLYAPITSKAFFTTPAQWKISHARFGRQQPNVKIMPDTPSLNLQKTSSPSPYPAKQFNNASFFGKKPLSQTIMNKNNNAFCPLGKAFFSIKAGEWADPPPLMTHYLSPDLVHSFKNNIPLTLKQLTPSTISTLIRQMRSWQRENLIEKVKNNPTSEHYFIVQAFENPQTIATLLTAFARVLVDQYSYEAYAAFVINFLYTHFHDSFLKGLDMLPADAAMHGIVGQILVKENVYQSDKDFEQYPGAALALLKGLAHQHRILFGITRKPNITAQELAIAQKKLANQKQAAIRYAQAARSDEKNASAIANLLRVFDLP